MHATSTLISPLVLALELAGIGVILGGFILATVIWLGGLRRTDSHSAYIAYRRRSVRGLILGLEFLVAADVIKTVTVDYSLESVATLGVIVLIRSFLVFALHMEVEGRMPWRESADSGQQKTAP